MGQFCGPTCGPFSPPNSRNTPHSQRKLKGSEIHPAYCRMRARIWQSEESLFRVNVTLLTVRSTEFVCNANIIRQLMRSEALSYPVKQRWCHKTSVLRPFACS